MNRSLLLAVAATAVAGCGSSTPGDGGPPNINPCATPDASYVETLTQTAGTCDAAPTRIVPVAQDGEIALDPSVTCANRYQNGCTEWDSACTWTSDGVSYSATTVVTFDPDAGSASGILDVSAEGNGVTCTGLWGVTAVPQ